MIAEYCLNITVVSARKTCPATWKVVTFTCVRGIVRGLKRRVPQCWIVCPLICPIRRDAMGAAKSVASEP